MLRSRPVEALAAVAVAVALAGCGDDSEQVNEQELVTKGDEICKQGQERFAEIQAEPPASADEAAEQTDELIDSAQEELDGLQRLEPPEELSKPYESYLDSKREALELLEQGRDAAEDQDAKSYGELQGKVADDAPKRRRLAEAVGLKTCSNP